jgi:DNA-binding NarL/FixJ family response regulator
VVRPLPGTKPDRLAPATDRDVDLVRLVAQGRSSAEIAREPFLSEATVKTHVSWLLATLDLGDRVQLTVMAFECGLVAPGDFANG